VEARDAAVEVERVGEAQPVAEEAREFVEGDGATGDGEDGAGPVGAGAHAVADVAGVRVGQEAGVQVAADDEHRAGLRGAVAGTFPPA
jgi:hypothetical protein